jgi:hypothetical protein
MGWEREGLHDCASTTARQRAVLLNQLDSWLNQLVIPTPITRLTVYGRRIDFLLPYYTVVTAPSLSPLCLNSPPFLFYTVRVSG